MNSLETTQFILAFLSFGYLTGTTFAALEPNGKLTRFAQP